MSQNKENNADDGKKLDKQALAQMSNTLVGKLKVKWSEFKGEFKRIIWPDKKSLARSTVNVIITSAIVGLVIVAFDLLFGNAYGLFIGLFS